MVAALRSPWVRGDQREQERRDKREAVLRTAVRLFNQKGYHATSLDEVARQLQVTKPTLYHYVHSKDEILSACVQAGMDMLRAGIEQSRAAGGSALDQLVEGMRAYTRVVCADFGMCVIRVGEDPLPPDSRQQLRAAKREIDAEFRRLVSECAAQGLLRPCDARLAAFGLAGALSWVGRWYRADGALRPEQIADELVELLLRGLLPPGGTLPPRATPSPEAAPKAARKRSSAAVRRPSK